jgi:predicted secreted Zn-dependent protease
MQRNVLRKNRFKYFKLNSAYKTSSQENKNILGKTYSLFSISVKIRRELQSQLDRFFYVLPCICSFLN